MEMLIVRVAPLERPKERLFGRLGGWLPVGRRLPVVRRERHPSFVSVSVPERRSCRSPRGPGLLRLIEDSGVPLRGEWCSAIVSLAFCWLGALRPARGLGCRHANLPTRVVVLRAEGSCRALMKVPPLRAPKELLAFRTARGGGGVLQAEEP
eukprot:scaffold434_cov186-Pinguiococcus_pyrenoidosus.AAC.39